MLRKAAKRRNNKIKRRENAAACSGAKGCESLDKEKLKAEIERIQRLIDNKHSKFIHDELKQYLKILKRELKEKE